MSEQRKRCPNHDSPAEYSCGICGVDCDGTEMCGCEGHAAARCPAHNPLHYRIAGCPDCKRILFPGGRSFPLARAVTPNERPLRRSPTTQAFAAPVAGWVAPDEPHRRMRTPTPAAAEIIGRLQEAEDQLDVVLSRSNVDEPEVKAAIAAMRACRRLLFDPSAEEEENA